MKNRKKLIIIISLYIVTLILFILILFMIYKDTKLISKYMEMHDLYLKNKTANPKPSKTKFLVLSTFLIITIFVFFILFIFIEYIKKYKIEVVEEANNGLDKPIEDENKNVEE